MKELTLCITSDTLPEEGDCALWQGREAKADVFCLEKILEERLLQIRQEHEQWAFAIGQLELDSGETFQQRLECGSLPSMWWTSLVYERHPKLSPNLYPVYKLRCLEILLRENRYNSLILIGGSKSLQQSMAQLCEAYAISFAFKPGAIEAQTKAQGVIGKIYQALPGPLRAIIRLGHWLATIRSKLSSTTRLPALGSSESGQKTAATITTYFPNLDLEAAKNGRFRSRYWENLHTALNYQAKLERPNGPHFVRWLLIRFPAPNLSFAKCRKLAREFQKKGKDGLSFNFLEEFIYPDDIAAALRRWARLCSVSFRLEKTFAQNCHFAESRLDFWPYMREQWVESMRGWRCLERCLQNRAFRNFTRLAGPQRWNLFPLENCPWERMLTVACREIPKNGKVIGAQHSTIRPTDFRYFDASQTFTATDCEVFQPDVIAGNGASACDQWRQNALPVKRLTQVEALRYLYLAKVINNSLEDCSKASKRMLILTSFFIDETRTHLELVKKCLVAGLLNDWTLVLKPHPYLSVQWWLDRLTPVQKKNIRLSNAPIAQELQPGVSVWASNSTTASLEAALCKLPLMVMAASNDFDLCPIQDAAGLLRTATVEDVQNALPVLAPPMLQPDYLDLNPALPAWRKLLDLNKPREDLPAKESQQ